MKKRAGLAPERWCLNRRFCWLMSRVAAWIESPPQRSMSLLVRCKTEHGTALIIVTHDVHGARRLADRVAVLDKGTLVAFGSVDEVSQSENEVARKLITE